jgi:hypothetical protein
LPHVDMTYHNDYLISPEIIYLSLYLSCIGRQSNFRKNI